MSIGKNTIHNNMKSYNLKYFGIDIVFAFLLQTKRTEEQQELTQKLIITYN